MKSEASRSLLLITGIITGALALAGLWIFAYMLQFQEHIWMLLPVMVTETILAGASFGLTMKYIHR